MTKAQGKRSNKLKGYYASHFAITKANKDRRAVARAKRKAAWIKRGTKKNGAPIKAHEPKNQSKVDPEGNVKPHSFRQIAALIKKHL